MTTRGEMSPSDPLVFEIWRIRRRLETHNMMMLILVMFATFWSVLSVVTILRFLSALP